MYAPAPYEQPRMGAVGFQFSHNVEQIELITPLIPVTGSPVQTLVAAEPVSAAQPTGVDALYARLNAAYDAMPVAKNRRGGAPGDPYPL